jgi:hypothetical protein
MPALEHDASMCVDHGDRDGQSEAGRFRLNMIRDVIRAGE